MGGERREGVEEGGRSRGRKGIRRGREKGGGCEVRGVRDRE